LGKNSESCVAVGRVAWIAVNCTAFPVDNNVLHFIISFRLKARPSKHTQATMQKHYGVAIAYAAVTSLINTKTATGEILVLQQSFRNS